MRKREREREIVRKEQLTVTWLRTILQVNDNTQKKKKTAFRCNAINVKMGELQTKLKKKTANSFLPKLPQFLYYTHSSAISPHLQMQ